MNKKSLAFAITAVLLIILMKERPLYSQSNLPFPDPQPFPNAPPLCQQFFMNDMHAMRKAWEQQLETITGQEEPASDRVDDAFESVRTYRCWLEYLCRSVNYSGTAPPGESGNLPLTEDHLGKAPGCTDPDDVEIPGFTDPPIHHFPACFVPTDIRGRITAIQNNYDACLRLAELEFGTPVAGSESEKLQTLKNTSTVYVTLEAKLREVHAKQTARALEEKLRRILERMRSMETGAQNLKGFFQKLDQLLPCYIQQCT